MGPDYCRACQAKRGAPTPCEDCPRPALLPENAAAARLYQVSLTQARLDASGRFAGFDYAGVRAAARLAGLTLTRDTFAQFRVLEHETVNVVQGRKTDEAAG